MPKSATSKYQQQDNRFLHRMRGHGPRWKMVRQVFEAHCRRLGLAIREDADLPLARSFRRPSAQGELFDPPQPHSQMPLGASKKGHERG